MKWKALHMPKGIVKEKGEAKYGKFVIEPLERGWGVTLGNALRRVLLSSLQGAAVVSVRFEGASHEFSTLEGVKEDVAEIILNLKKLRVKLLSDEDATLRIDVSGEGEVRAEHIETNPLVKILNPELHIATLAKGGNLSVELRISDGRGYVSAEDLKREDDPIGVIPIDADFSPVSKVAYEVSDTRVGQRTDFNRLEMDIWTDGSIEPEDALAYASKLLVDHIELFINFEGDLETADEAVKDEERDRVKQLLKMRVDELELSVRPATACVARIFTPSLTWSVTRKPRCSSTRISGASPSSN